MSNVVLVTGSYGYIGSHICEQLLKEGYRVVGIDSEELSNPSATTYLETFEDFEFINIDLRDLSQCKKLSSYQFEVVIHCAGYKYGLESIAFPSKYFSNNVGSLVNLIETLDWSRVDHFIFSGTAAVYGSRQHDAVEERAPLEPQTPYAISKLMCENILEFAIQDTLRTCAVTVLRYFNPVGYAQWWELDCSHSKPKSFQDALYRSVTGSRDFLIYGDTHGTPDGTCIRDFISIYDLVQAHLTCVSSNRHKMLEHKSQTAAYNVGTGCGISIRQAVDYFNRNLRGGLSYAIVESREDDIPVSFCNANLIKRNIGWSAKSPGFRSLEVLLLRLIEQGY